MRVGALLPCYAAVSAVFASPMLRGASPRTCPHFSNTQVRWQDKCVRADVTNDVADVPVLWDCIPGERSQFWDMYEHVIVLHSLNIRGDMCPECQSWDISMTGVGPSWSPYLLKDQVFLGRWSDDTPRFKVTPFPSADEGWQLVFVPFAGDRKCVQVTNVTTHPGDTDTRLMLANCAVDIRQQFLINGC